MHTPISERNNFSSLLDKLFQKICLFIPDADKRTSCCQAAESVVREFALSYQRQLISAQVAGQLEVTSRMAAATKERQELHQQLSKLRRLVDLQRAQIEHQAVVKSQTTPQEETHPQQMRISELGKEGQPPNQVPPVADPERERLGLRLEEATAWLGILEEESVILTPNAALRSVAQQTTAIYRSTTTTLLEFLTKVVDDCGAMYAILHALTLSRHVGDSHQPPPGPMVGGNSHLDLTGNSHHDPTGDSHPVSMLGDSHRDPTGDSRTPASPWGGIHLPPEEEWGMEALERVGLTGAEYCGVVARGGIGLAALWGRLLRRLYAGSDMFETACIPPAVLPATPSSGRRGAHPDPGIAFATRVPATTITRVATITRVPATTITGVVVSRVPATITGVIIAQVPATTTITRVPATIITTRQGGIRINHGRWYPGRRGRGGSSARAAVPIAITRRQAAPTAVAVAITARRMRLVVTGPRRLGSPLAVDEPRLVPAIANCPPVGGAPLGTPAHPPANPPASTGSRGATAACTAVRTRSNRHGNTAACAPVAASG
ncbi:hypothetical protein PAPYR_6389 [Paratrimastix pyriformis]|uniref:Uncharacterized protein n=1 Tax=Paratrimastix pyriformis TaxID=342808 RepID=A0ABQ8UFG8_9EUKA|nr:hypothetical protein PAPYR_6389 [Paratrimastix pyriformis]